MCIYDGCGKSWTIAVAALKRSSAWGIVLLDVNKVLREISLTQSRNDAKPQVKEDKEHFIIK